MSVGGVDALIHGLRASLGASLVTKIASFIFNALLARYVSKDIYGIGYLSFQLLINLQLFILREGYRRAVQRVTDVDDKIRILKQGIFKASSLTLFVVFLAWYLPLEYGNFVGSESGATRHAKGEAGAEGEDVHGQIDGWSNEAMRSRETIQSQKIALFFLLLAGVAEACCEPMIAEAHRTMVLHLKPQAEAIGLAVRSAVLTLSVMLLNADFIIMYGLAHSVYILVFAMVFILHFRSKGQSLMELELVKGVFFGKVLQRDLTKRDNKEVDSLTLQMLLASIQKMVVSEGEKVLLVAVFPPEAWSIYALVSNLGSLVLRLIFAPIEEIAFAYFSAAEDSKAKTDTVITEKIQNRHRVLGLLLSVQGLIGFLGLLYGPPNCLMVIFVLYGRDWASSPATIHGLQWFCCFLFFSSLNGILEGYVVATASSDWISKNTKYQVGLSILFLIVSIGLQQLLHLEELRPAESHKSHNVPLWMMAMLSFPSYLVKLFVRHDISALIVGMVVCMLLRVLRYMCFVVYEGLSASNSMSTRMTKFVGNLINSNSFRIAIGLAIGAAISCWGIYIFEAQLYFVRGEIAVEATTQSIVKTVSATRMLVFHVVLVGIALLVSIFLLRRRFRSLVDEMRSLRDSKKES